MRDSNLLRKHMADSEETQNPDEPKAAESSGTSTLTWVIYAVGAAILLAILTQPKKESPKPITPVNITSDQKPMVKFDPVQPSPEPTEEGPKFILADEATNRWNPDRVIKYWWDTVPEEKRTNSLKLTAHSNVTREDYAGSKSCQKCHESKYNDWQNHPHKWMNANAMDALKGDFSGKKTIKYKGGTGRFVMEDGHPKMILERGDIYWRYRITRTIGSRFFQYYVGLLEEERGSNLPWKKERRTIEGVLPFGYWFDAGDWIPTVHVLRDFDTDEAEVDPYNDWHFLSYDTACAECHTTWAFGDWIIRNAGATRFTGYTPHDVDVHLGKLMQTQHPDRVPKDTPLKHYSYQDIEKIILHERQRPQTDERLSLGVTCESCHLGAAEHARKSTPEKSEVLPAFFPVSEHFYYAATNEAQIVNRSAVNVNFICARCHSGGRPMYANGTHTWNSTEFTQASNGHCYHPDKAAEKGMEILTCVSCHDPHKKTGAKWSRTPRQDDQSCIRCHQQFNTPEKQTAHTHHAPDTEGSRCMNCHMPRYTEGLQDMIRTHRIQSPVAEQLVKQNQVNACNLCHLDKSINWTVQHVREWYPGRHEFVDELMTKYYSDRNAPIAPGWIKNRHAATRLAGADAAARRMPGKYLDLLLDLLIVDNHTINRQFIQRRLLESLGIDLKAEGYQFYQGIEERRKIINDLRAGLIKTHQASKTAINN